MESGDEPRRRSKRRANVGLKNGAHAPREPVEARIEQGAARDASLRAPFWLRWMRTYTP